MRIVAIVLLISAVISSVPSYSQNTDCEQVLIHADDEFNAGRFYGIPALLKPCLENGFSNEQKVRAYLILTQAYLILDDPIGADDSYLKLLRADPEFVADPSRDPIDVYYLSKKFTSTPVFTPHFRVGLNTCIPRTIHEINTSGIALDRRDVFKPGLQAGVGVDWNIDNHWSIGAEGNYAYKAFKRETKGYFRHDNFELTERQNWIDIPLYVKYADDSGKIRPFGYIGMAFNLLISSSGSLRFVDITPPQSEFPATGPDEKINYKRNTINRSLVIGGGFKYKIGKDFVYADVRYMAGLTNLTKTEKNYYAEDGSFDPSIPQYQYISDLFRLDNLSISFGYIHPIYNPRKKTRPKIGFLKKKKATTIEEED